ncbi:hypothetical protein E1A91_D08G298400v1 [Gossypium mustelinum]|uniref:Transmembrane protein n=1 Tax=Gossypium mustelinum TaxID=34275 RepID=A0A5D2U231_GOSMU|nr:hypothetical protein E1A91_D08G298400v1 [Gossypium mustelinum]
MEGLPNLVRSFPKDTKSGSPSFFPELPYNLRGGGGSGGAAGASSVDTARVLVSRPPRQVVSLWTCSKLCGFCFVAGIIVGYSLKRRVRLWASKLLKRLKDD